MAKIYYHATPVDWRKERKYKFLDEARSISGVEWRELIPDAKHNWLTEGMRDEFETFISIGDKTTKEITGRDVNAIFAHFTNGVKTNRDSWCYNFSRDELAHSISRTISFFNSEVHRWLEPENQIRIKKLLASKKSIKEEVDNFVRYVPEKIAWTRDLKLDLRRVGTLVFDESKIRRCAYRPFVRQNLYFDRVLNEEIYSYDHVYPTALTEQENIAVSVTAIGNNAPFQCLAASTLGDVHLTGDTTSFSFYTYNEDGTNRRENITDWALEQFHERYASLQKPARSKGIDGGEEGPYSVRASATAHSATVITKWDIFHYTYAILHHPEYRERYAANLKRELPRIPFAPDFWGFAKAGKELAHIHVNYEEQPEYKLEMIENEKLALNWRVEKMKYADGKTAIIYNDFLTLRGVPPEAHEYRLGNRSALDWIVDQYKVSTDKRSGITNDPNRDDEPQYIVRLIKKIVTVSLRTNEIVKNLPALRDHDGWAEDN